MFNVSENTDCSVCELPPFDFDDKKFFPWRYSLTGTADSVDIGDNCDARVKGSAI